MSTWTVAYRKPNANRFLRYSGLAASWNDAYDFAVMVKEDHPRLEVHCTTTAQYDADNPSEDANNILAQSGRRVRVIETNALP